MSCYIIYYENGAKKMRPVISETEYRALRDSGQQKALVAAARSGNSDEKRKLMQCCYSCLPNDDSTLKGSTTPSNTVGVDIDFDKNDPNYEQKMAGVPRLILDNRERIGLKMLERSATKGYHMVVARREHMTQEENLRWVSDTLGIEYDRGAKDITRVFYTTTCEDLLYLHPSLFVNEAATGADDSPTVLLLGTGAETGTQDETGTQAETGTQDETGTGDELTFHGIAFSELVKIYLRLFNEGKEPAEGERNVTTFEMAMTFRPIVNYNLEQLMQVIPRYDNMDVAEYKQTLINALNEPKKGRSYRLTQVLKLAREEHKRVAMSGNVVMPPAPPEKMPQLIKLLTSKVPDLYKAAVAEAVWPSLAAHLHGVTFRYTDNTIHEAEIMTVLMAPMSIGKGSVNPPIDYILADIMQSDEMSRKRDKEWKDRNRMKGANKEKDPRPEDICIQCLMSDVTNAALVQRLIDAERNGGRTIYTRLDEIELLNQIKSSGKGDSVGQLIRLAFDRALYGQERVGTDSVSGTARVRWNWNASTTIERGRQYMRNWVNDGTLSRLSFCTIMRDPNKEDDGEMPVFGIYDDQFAADLQPYIERLNVCSGMIECPQALALARKLTKENHEKAKCIYESEAYKVLSYRANVIAYTKAMILYIANDYKWTKEIEKYVRWSEDYDLWCKMKFFGDQLEADLEAEKEYNARGPQNLLNLLPKEFSIEQFKELRQSLARKGNGAGTLRTWIHRKLVVWDDATGTYHKVGKGK